MLFITDDVRLAVLQAADAEEFETGYPEPLVAKFSFDYLESAVGEHSVANSSPFIRCRTSDVTLHGLIKQSVITRSETGVQYTCSKFEPDHSGMTNIRLRA